MFFKFKRKENLRFTAMSKLIGIFIAILLFIMIIYAMYEMHIQHDLSCLSQLIISIFGVFGIYIGFYLNMAKVEHIEQEKTNREKQLLKLKKTLDLYNPEEEIEEIKQDICNLKEKELDLLLKDVNTYD